VASSARRGLGAFGGVRAAGGEREDRWSRVSDADTTACEGVLSTRMGEPRRVAEAEARYCEGGGTPSFTTSPSRCSESKGRESAIMARNEDRVGRYRRIESVLARTHSTTTRSKVSLQKRKPVGEGEIGLVNLQSAAPIACLRYE